MKKNPQKKEDSDLLLSAKKLSDLLVERIDTTEYLNDILQTHNSLSVKPEEAEEWVFGLPAKNITQLHNAGKGVSRTCLQDMKLREFCKKEYRIVQDKANKLDSDIKLAKIDLLINKANKACQKKKK